MIRLIAAIDSKHGLARGGAIPWDIADDRSFFREQTTSKGGVILMGKQTFDTIGHPLKNRRNIILSNKLMAMPGAEIVNNLSILNTLRDVWVIGGEAVFKQTIDLADELYLTHVDDDFNCDQFFPSYTEKFLQKWRSDTKMLNNVKFWYEVLTRRPR